MIEETDHVLVPLDGDPPSERALPIAIAIAQRFGLPIRLLSVVAEPDEEAERVRYVAGVARSIATDHHPQVVSEQVVVQARAADGIVDYYDPGGLLVMATRSEIFRYYHYVGSEAETVVRATHRSVLLVGPQCSLTDGFSPDRVVIAVDGSALAEHAVPLGLDWAERLDLPVTLLRVDDGTPAERSASMDYLRALTTRLPSVGDGRDVAVEAAQFDATPSEAESPARAIAAIGADSLVVLATHARTGISRIAEGSVTADLYAEARQPVLLIHPASASTTALAATELRAQ